MRPQDTAYIIERLAVWFMAMVADHERQLAEHRASFGARTEADAKIIAGLREERDRWKSAFYDQSALLGVINAALGIHAGDDVCGEIDRLHKERDGLLTQVQDMRAEMERLQMEVAALKSQTPKHPVKVGEWVRRLVPSPACGVGTVAKVVHVDDDTSEIEYDVKRIDGQHGVWFAKNCEPCDPPTVKREPEVGDTVRLVRVPTMEEYADWEDEFGVVGSLGIVKSLAHQVANVKYNDFTWEWPLSCVEVVTEATHDTEAGKAAAERAAKTYPVEIKVGDLVEVVSNRGRNTYFVDIGSFGTVTSVEEINESISVHLDDEPGKKNALAGYVSFCDVRKVTT